MKPIFFFAEPTMTPMVTEFPHLINYTKVNATKDFYEISNIRISGNETRQGNRICPTGMLEKD